MKKNLYEFVDKIRELPLKDKYTKDELLTENFLLDKESNIEIYYSPHNEYLNKAPKIIIIGITPGFQQMSTAIATARKELELGSDIKEIQYKCKQAGRFSGVIRKNIISMLDDISLNNALNINSSSELFNEKDYLLHTISLIPYPTFVKRENYSGHTPKLIKSDFLMKYVYKNFIDELNSLDTLKETLLIPLGRAVEEILLKLEEEGILEKGQILLNFPHPSGANVNRVNQFNENKNNMISFIKEKYNK